MAINHSIAQQAVQSFTQTIDWVVRNLEASRPELLRQMFDDEEFVLVDVNPGRMPYDVVLAEWASNRHTNPKLFAVDESYESKSGGVKAIQRLPLFKNDISARTIFVPERIEKAGQLLAGLGVKKVHLFTMFKPDAPTVGYLMLLGGMAEKTPLLIAEPTFEAAKALEPNGYEIVFSRRNPYSNLLKPSFGSAYDKVTFAVPKQTK